MWRWPDHRQELRRAKSAVHLLATRVQRAGTQAYWIVVGLSPNENVFTFAYKVREDLIRDRARVDPLSLLSVSSGNSGPERLRQVIDRAE